MAIVEGIAVPQSGTAGAFTYYVRNGRVICRQRHNKCGRVVRTRKKMSQLTKMANLVSSWRAFGGSLKGNFELKRSGQTDYNAFISMNLRSARVYLTKDEQMYHVRVADNFQISFGTMDRDIQVQTTENMYVSDIKVSKPIDLQNTTVSALALDIVSTNPSRFEFGDKLTFYRTVPQTNTLEGRSWTFDVFTYNIKLDLMDHRPLSMIISPSNSEKCGLLVEQDCLACSKMENSLIAWVHSRELDEDKTLISTQKLVGDDKLLVYFANEIARDSAIESYGNLKEKYFDKAQAVVNPYEVTEQNAEMFNHVTFHDGVLARQEEPQDTQNQEVEIKLEAYPEIYGVTSGSGRYKPLEMVSIKAMPIYWDEHEFICWSDGCKDAERIIYAKKSITLKALFRRRRR